METGSDPGGDQLDPGWRPAPPQEEEEELHTTLVSEVSSLLYIFVLGNEGTGKRRSQQVRYTKNASSFSAKQVGRLVISFDFRQRI